MLHSFVLIYEGNSIDFLERKQLCFTKQYKSVHIYIWLNDFQYNSDFQGKHFVGFANKYLLRPPEVGISELFDINALYFNF